MGGGDKIKLLLHSTRKIQKLISSDERSKCGKVKMCGRKQYLSDLRVENGIFLMPNSTNNLGGKKW